MAREQLSLTLPLALVRWTTSCSVSDTMRPSWGRGSNSSRNSVWCVKHMSVRPCLNSDHCMLHSETLGNSSSFSELSSWSTMDLKGLVSPICSASTSLSSLVHPPPPSPSQAASLESDFTIPSRSAPLSLDGSVNPLESPSASSSGSFVTILTLSCDIVSLICAPLIFYLR